MRWSLYKGGLNIGKLKQAGRIAVFSSGWSDYQGVVYCLGWILGVTINFLLLVNALS